MCYHNFIKANYKNKDLSFIADTGIDKKKWIKKVPVPVDPLVLLKMTNIVFVCFIFS
jgi:hypothetical protein